MKWIGFLLVLLVLWLPLNAVCGETITHIGDTNPVDEGWKVTLGIAGEPDAELEPNWRVATAGHGKWEPADGVPIELFEDEWSLTIRCKWNAGAVGAQRCTIFDGVKGHSLSFDGLGYYYYIMGLGDTLIPGSSADGQFHTVSMTWDKADAGVMSYMFDGVEFDRLPRDQQNDITPGATLLYWGDNNGDGGFSDVQWSYICFTNEMIPEPSTCLLLLTGLLAVAVGCRCFR